MQKWSLRKIPSMRKKMPIKFERVEFVENLFRKKKEGACEMLG